MIVRGNISSPGHTPEETWCNASHALGPPDFTKHTHALYQHLSSNLGRLPVALLPWALEEISCTMQKIRMWESFSPRAPSHGSFCPKHSSPNSHLFFKNLLKKQFLWKSCDLSSVLMLTDPAAWFPPSHWKLRKRRELQHACPLNSQYCTQRLAEFVL